MNNYSLLYLLSSEIRLSPVIFSKRTVHIKCSTYLSGRRKARWEGRARKAALPAAGSVCGCVSAAVFLFQLILGIPEQALSLLHMAIEPILADGAVLDKGRAMFLVAKCQVASAASCDPPGKAEGRKLEAVRRLLGNTVEKASKRRTQKKRSL